MEGYILRNIPDELWDAVRHRAIEEGTSARGILLKALEEYLKSVPRVGK